MKPWPLEHFDGCRDLFNTPQGLDFLCVLFDEADGDAAAPHDPERYVLLQLFWTIMKGSQINVGRFFERYAARRQYIAATADE